MRIIFPVNALSCMRKWLSDGLLQLLARTEVRNALDGRCGCRQDASLCERTSREPCEHVAPVPSIIQTHLKDLDWGMGSIECVDAKGIGDTNIHIVRESMATKCLSVGKQGLRPSSKMILGTKTSLPLLPATWHYGQR